MIDRGRSLMKLKKFDVDRPLLVLHGSGDKICSHKASKAFVDGLEAKDKLYVEYDGWYHKCECLSLSPSPFRWAYIIDGTGTDSSNWDRQCTLSQARTVPSSPTTLPCGSWRGSQEIAVAAREGLSCEWTE